MGAEHRLARAMFDEAHRTFAENVRGISIEEALDAGGGFRSILGLMKHTVGWSVVYHSYAFADEPRSWEEIGWPRALREEIEPTEAYLQEMLEWSSRRTSVGWRRFRRRSISTASDRFPGAGPCHSERSSR